MALSKETCSINDVCIGHRVVGCCWCWYRKRENWAYNVKRAHSMFQLYFMLPLRRLLLRLSVYDDSSEPKISIKYVKCAVSGYELGVDFCRATSTFTKNTLSFLFLSIHTYIGHLCMFLLADDDDMIVAKACHTFTALFYEEILSKMKMKIQLECEYVPWVNCTRSRSSRQKKMIVRCTYTLRTKFPKKNPYQLSTLHNNLISRYCGSSVLQTSAQFEFRSFHFFFNAIFFYPLQLFSLSLWVFIFAQFVCNEQK